MFKKKKETHTTETNENERKGIKNEKKPTKHNRK